MVLRQNRTVGRTWCVLPRSVVLLEVVFWAMRRHRVPVLKKKKFRQPAETAERQSLAGWRGLTDEQHLRGQDWFASLVASGRCSRVILP